MATLSKRLDLDHKPRSYVGAFVGLVCIALFSMTSQTAGSGTRTLYQWDKESLEIAHRGVDQIFADKHFHGAVVCPVIANRIASAIHASKSQIPASGLISDDYVPMTLRISYDANGNATHFEIRGLQC